jgi:hypothetical protein
MTLNAPPMTLLLLLLLMLLMPLVVDAPPRMLYRPRHTNDGEYIHEYRTHDHLLG